MKGMKCKRRQKRRAGRKTGEEAKALNSLLFFYYFSSFCQDLCYRIADSNPGASPLYSCKKVGLFGARKAHFRRIFVFPYIRFLPRQKASFWPLIYRETTGPFKLSTKSRDGIRKPRKRENFCRGVTRTHDPFGQRRGN